MRRLLLSTIVFALLTANSFSQKEVNRWYFGGFRGLDFTGGGTPTVITTNAMNTWEGCSSISDNCTGELLFYTNGVKVWDKNDIQMPNGIGLLGGNTTGLTPSSTTQSSVIVPKPGNKNLYYIFTCDANENNNVGGFRYSIVDMTLNGGLGDVTVKNTLLFAPGTEKVTAVHHSNKRDIWVISHGKLDNKFYAYLVSAAGVSAPVITLVGLNEKHQTGYLKVSFDGKKLSMCDYNNFNQTGDAQIFDFSNTSGVVSNPFTIPGNNYYGTEFSPNSQLVYFGRSSKFDQYDLTAGTPAFIIASKQDLNVQANYGSVWAMQRASDGKMYCAMGYQSLHVVNNPNVVGSGANMVKRQQPLATGSPGMGITNFVQSFFEPSMFLPRGGLPTATITAAGSCVDQPITFASVSSFTLDIDSVKWTFGDPASGALNVSTDLGSTHTYNSPTYYLVQLIRFADCGSDTTYYSLNVDPKPELSFNDSTICFGEPFSLTSNIEAATYLWQDGSAESFLNITNSGTYWLEVTSQCGTDRDTANIVFEDCEATLYVPNAFVPGMSLDNYLFEAKGVNLATFNMKIFDRWGILLFESYDINKGWNGTYKGKVCQQDVYVWRITYESIASSRENVEGSQKLLQKVGHVTLLR